MLASRLTLPFLVALAILLAVSASRAVELSIAPGIGDTGAYTLIEQAHAKGIALWKANRRAEALELFKVCETALKARGLWSPPKLPDEPKPNELRAHAITNQVIFSLAAIHQQMGNRSESERYAAQARERGLLPRLHLSGSRK